MALGSTQLLTEITTANLPGGKGRPARKADNLTALLADCLEHVGASTSHNPMDLHSHLTGIASSLLFFPGIESRPLSL
jgi:hypothetical protein